MAWKIRIKASVEKELRAIPVQDSECILAELERITGGDPREHGKRLEGTEFYSHRVSSYRIIYKVVEDEQAITILRIGQRGYVYRNLDRLH